jgi:hypothetical protein
MISARLVFALAILAAMPAHASSPDAWAELFKRASAACARASDLKKPRTGTPVDFPDKVLVIVDGIWPQPHMKNAPARFACLYDKRSRTAEAAELPR